MNEDPAWPTLRAHLVLLAATGADPIMALHSAANARELDTADDRAAVLDWRLHDPGTAGTGPLPWLPGIPQTIAEDLHWGPYLTARCHLVTTLADQVRHQATSTPNSRRQVAVTLTVWSAAYGSADGPVVSMRPRVTVSTTGQAVGVLDIFFPWLGEGTAPDGYGYGVSSDLPDAATLTSLADFPCTIHAESARVFVFDVHNADGLRRLRADVTLIGGTVVRSAEIILAPEAATAASEPS